MSNILCYWWNTKPNVGDALNPYILKHLTNKNIIRLNDLHNNDTHLFMIGSILNRINSNSIVWGTGAMYSNIKFNNIKPIIHAVRGPLTRKVLLNNNIDCPTIYGDPALLTSKFYKTNITKKYKIGLIPHYVDFNNKFILKYKHDNNIKILNIATTNIVEFINSMLECEIIISSSLHGLILADSFNLKSYWIKLSNLICGGDFKFIDYYNSIHRNITEPIIINNTTNIYDIINIKNDTTFDIDLELLYETRPKTYL